MLHSTHHRNCTLTTMYTLMSYHVTLTARLITHITVIEMFTIMQALMRYMTNLLTKCLITDITAMCALASTHVLCYHVSL
jgi:hypothetical protein